jgi:negative regulator of genetic competence, sporulation and motility
MQNCKYVVPALLPSQKENNMAKPFSKRKFSEKEKLYFIFTPNNMIADHLFNLSDCSKVGFLPSGLFERLLAKSVAWCIETSAYEVGSRDGVMNWNYQDYHFDRSEAFLSYGNQFFILKLELEYNAISLIIDGPNKKWIYDRVLEQLQSMISECMDCLEVVCGLSWKHSLNPVCLEDEYDDNDQSISEEEDATTKLEDQKIASIEEEATKIKEAMKDCLLKYESIEQCITNSKYLNFSMHGKVYQIPSMNLQTNYEFWMKRRNALDKYDIFISYRWGGSHHHFDSNLAKGIFDGLSGRLVDNPKRSIETFLDIQRLQEGRRFDADFSRALSNSLIFVPLVSSYALTRMLHHDPMKVDNVLAEWIIGLDCYSRFENGTSMEYSIQLQRIYPIFIGSQEEEGDDAYCQGNMKNLFEESILDELPKIVPVATIEMIEKNLNRPLLPVYKVVTVHEVVNTLKKFLCINAFEIVHGSVLTNKLIPCCFVRLSKSLRGLLVEIQAKKNEKNDIIIEKNDIVLKTTESDFSDAQSTFTIDFECLAALYLSEKIDECQAIVRYVSLFRVFNSIFLLITLTLWLLVSREGNY